MGKFKEEKTGAPEWITTFADIISLLVTFFVLLLTYNTMDQKKLRLVKGGMQGSFGFLSDESRDLPSLQNRAILIVKKPKKQISELPGPQENDVNQKPPHKKGTPINPKDTASWHLKMAIYFKPGSSRLPKKAYEILDSLAGALRNTNNHITIKGYAHFIATRRIAHTYNLAMSRAYKARSYLVKKHKIAETRVSITAGIRTKNKDSLARKKTRTVEIVVWDKSLSNAF